MPGSCAPLVEPTLGKAPLNSRRIIIDTREPWPHPWARYLPQGDPGPRRPLGRIGAVILFENPRMITRPAALTAFLLPILLHIDRDYSTAPHAGLRLGPGARTAWMFGIETKG
jgi:hypothetical protein